jgi:hypothetical protein
MPLERCIFAVTVTERHMLHVIVRFGQSDASINVQGRASAEMNTGLKASPHLHLKRHEHNGQ